VARALRRVTGMFLQQCPHCAHVNPTGSRFCNACGGPLDLAPCPNCGAINAAGDASCRECGTRLAPPGEREPALRRELEPPSHRAPPSGGRIEHAMRRDAARDDPHSIQPRRPAGADSQPPPPASSTAPPEHARNASRRSPHAAVTVIAVSLVALAVLALGYAWTLRNALEREGAAPAPSSAVAASPEAAPSPAAGTPAPDTATGAAPVLPAAASDPAAAPCPPAVAAMGLCRTFEASATRR